MTMIRLKRIYEEPSEDDGMRILVDRIWPRGVSKEAARIDAWWKEIAPTADLRKQFDHVPARWEDFREQYKRQLDTADLTGHLDSIRGREVTFLFAAKEERYNNAVALREYVTRLIS